MDLRWVYPLGLLGLLALLVLILIYVLKPNYQQKYISSTHVWKLSLKYRKKRIPISKIANLLIILCQIMIIVIGAYALTRPFVADALPPPTNEAIFIIDSSANMLAHHDEGDVRTTRFSRAIEEARERGHAVLENDEYLTIILAQSTADAVASRLSGAVGVATLNMLMDSLLAEGGETGLHAGAIFGDADIDAAMRLAENFLELNPMADVTLFTATAFEQVPNVTIVDVSRMDSDEHGVFIEWNAAILNAVPVMLENTYRFIVEVASFNLDQSMSVNITVFGARGAGANFPAGGVVTASITEIFNDDEIVTIVFEVFGGFRIYAFESAMVYIPVSDSFAFDNEFWVFSGGSNTLRVLYVTPAASVFQRAMLIAMSNALSPRWNIEFEITSVAAMNYASRIPEGFDFYIFEYQMPVDMPTDGAVLLITGGRSFGLRDQAPDGAGLVFGDVINNDASLDMPAENRLFASAPGQILNMVNPANIVVNRIRQVAAPPSFQTHLYWRDAQGGGTYPALLVRNDDEARVAVKAFATLYSTFALSLELPVIMYNLMNIFFPATLQRYVYDIGESLVFDQSDAILNETRPSIELLPYGLDAEHYGLTFDSFPYNIAATRLGIHTITQYMSPGSSRRVTEHFFVRIPNSQSDFNRELSFEPPNTPEPPMLDYDIYIFLGLALFALLFVERLLAMSRSF